MKAYIIQKPGPLTSIQSIEIEKPEPASGEVQISVKGSSINPADVKVATGGTGSGFIHSKKSPIRLGFDFSGEITKIGEGVSTWKVGDEVYGHLPYSSKTVQGSYSEFVVVAANSIAHKPSTRNHAEAGTVPTTGSTALQALVDIGKIKPGMKVLINGASGGVGSYAVLLAKHFGAEVWGTAGTSNQAFMIEMGVDHPIDYKQQSVLELDQKFDIFFDVVSNLSYGKCKHVLNQGGVYITLLPDFYFVTGLISSLFSSKKCKMCVVKSQKETLEHLSQLVDEGKIKTPIASHFTMEKISDAMTFFNKNSVRGKIAIGL